MKKIKKIIVSVFVLTILCGVSILFASNSFARGKASRYDILDGESNCFKESCYKNYSELKTVLDKDGDASSFVHYDVFRCLGTSYGIGNGYAFISHTKWQTKSYQSFTYITWFKVEAGAFVRETNGAEYISSTLEPIKSQAYIYTHEYSTMYERVPNTYTITKLKNYSSNNLCATGMFTLTEVTGDESYIHFENSHFNGFNMASKKTFKDVLIDDGFAVVSDIVGEIPVVGDVWGALTLSNDLLKLGYDGFSLMNQSIRGNSYSNDEFFEAKYPIYPELRTNASFFAIRPINSGSQSKAIKDAGDYMKINTLHVRSFKEENMNYSVNLGITLYDDYNGNEVVLNTKNTNTVKAPVAGISGIDKGTFYLGSTYQAYNYSDGAVYYKFTCDAPGKYWFSSTDGYNHAYAYLYNQNGTLLDKNPDGLSRDMNKGETYYVKFVPLKERSGCSYIVNCGMTASNINANRISSVGNSRIGDSLPGDYANTYNFTFTVNKTNYYRVVTDGWLDTIIYVYVNGKLAYIEDDQPAYDDAYDDDLNAFFCENLTVGSNVTVVVAAYSNGTTNVSFS